MRIRSLDRLIGLGGALAFAAYALFYAYCGGGETPTVSIPAPIVTKMTISFPSGGKSTIIGQPGAVEGGNIVNAQNLTQEGLATKWEHVLWGIAYAATSVETTAGADGSFSMEIDANIGDSIRITQSDGRGNTSSALTLTAPYTPLSLAFVPSDIAVDPDNASAYAIGQSGGNGVATAVLLGQVLTLGSTIILPVQCNAPTAIAIDAQRDRLIVIDNTNGTVCAQPTNNDDGSLLSVLAVTPLNIAIHQDAAKAVITNNSGQVNVQVSLLDLATDTFAAVILPDPAGGVGQDATTSVAVGSSAGINYAFVIVSYVGGDDYGFIIDLNAAVVIGSGSRLGVGAPREVKIYNNTQAVLTDGDGMAHFLAIDVTNGSVTLPRSLTVGRDPIGVDIDPADGTAFVANRGDDTLSVISLTSSPESVVRTINMADGPKQIGYKDSTINQTAVIHNDQSVIIFSN